MLSRILAFLALSGVIVAIPGPTVVLILKSAITRGKKAAILVSVGVLVSDAIWVLASVIGLTAILLASQLAFNAIHLLGAGYLIYLGFSIFKNPSFTAPELLAAKSQALVSNRRSFLEGFLTEISNPKTVIVYASVIPQFMNGSTKSFDLSIFGVVFMFAAFVSLVFYTLIFDRAKVFFNNVKVMARTLRVSGFILMLFGGTLLTDMELK